MVTGSRIEKSDFAFSNPVQSVNSDSIRFSGTTNLGNFLKDFPALTGSLDANDVAGSGIAVGSTGLTLLNLRNLGTQRTLVLTNGRRHVAALPGSAAVDIDTIPIELVERVEILTGGASAIYGADGVSGVVNFVLQDDFEGLNVKARTGRSQESDAETHLISATGGTRLFDGRGHGMLSVEWSREERLRATERDFAGGGKRYYFRSNPFGDTPQLVPLRDIAFFDLSSAGAVDVDFDFVQDYNGTDTLWDSGTIPFISPFYQQGGDGARVDAFSGDLIPQEERITLNGIFDFAISERVSFFSELKYSQSDSLSRSEPTYDYDLYLEPDYAFYPTNIAAALRTGTVDAQPALVSRSHFDLGVRGEDIDRETVRGVFGFEGEINENLRYEASFVYGQTDITNSRINNRFNDRFAAALDAVIDPATGDAKCRSTLDPSATPYNLDWKGWGSEYTPINGTWAGSFIPGAGSSCVPINIIGLSAVSPEARRWIMTTSEFQSTLEQRVAQAYVSGDTTPWFVLPAGPIDFAAGIEYREERSSLRPPPEDRAGLTFGNKSEPVRGDFDVREAFAEINVPLLNGLPGVRELNFDAAARLSDYSTVGNTDTWKLGLVWSPIDDIVLRGTLAEATRAPNIGELFNPGGQTFRPITDPCDVNQLANGTQYRADNCNRLLTALGVDPAGYVDPNSARIPGTLTGNPDLAEEVADTRTVGIIVTPHFASNLTISVDWYDIDLKNAINTALPAEAANLCVDLPTLDNAFCSLVTREAGTGAVIDFVQRPENVAEFTTEGYDFTIDYTFDPADWGVKRSLGILDLRLVGNYLKDLTFINLPGAVPDDNRNEEGAPEWQYRTELTWEYDAFLLNYTYSWFDETLRYSNQTRDANPDYVAGTYWKYKARQQHDVHVEYAFRPATRVYLGINNVTDEQPDLGAEFYPVSAVGRYFYLGFDLSLDLPN